MPTIEWIYIKWVRAWILRNHKKPEHIDISKFIVNNYSYQSTSGLPPSLVLEDKELEVALCFL